VVSIELFKSRWESGAHTDYSVVEHKFTCSDYLRTGFGVECGKFEIAT
jgi:hypothetical protein